MWIATSPKRSNQPPRENPCCRSGLAPANLAEQPAGANRWWRNHLRCHARWLSCVLYAALVLVLTGLPVAQAEDPGEVHNSHGEDSRYLRELLQSRFEHQANDPDYVAADLARMAEYYARFPEVIGIFRSIDERRWTLKYRQKRWFTRPSGSARRLRGITVYFDPRTGGQVIKNRKCKDRPICRLSPADTFLHEMLHVRAMLLEFEKYVRQGGMSSAIYPLQHEYDVIHQERVLLKKMSRQDGRRRPNRTAHRGEAIAVSCVTCTD